jgi:hypothetical protein
VGTFKHYLTLGQSLPDGSQGTPALSTVSEVTNAYIVATNGTIANELKSSTIQRPYLSMGYRIAAASPADTFGFSTHALSGQSIAQLSKGGSSGRYEQAIATVTAAHTARVAAGDTYTVPWINWFQGEADQTFGTTRAAYRAALLQLMADYAADIMAITGQAEPPKWMINQTATWAHYENAASIGLEQLDIARTIPGVWAVGGQYQLPYADGLHMNNVGYYYVGELIGRAINAVNAGAAWKPFAPSSITATADGLTVTFDVPTGPLVLDTVLIPEQPFYGFSLSGTAAVITGVSLAGDTVTITTDKPVTESTARLGYGVSSNNGAVGLGNLRDSNAALSGYDSHPLPDFALHASDSFTPFPAVEFDRPQVIFRVTGWNYVGPTGLVPLTFNPAK